MHNISLITPIATGLGLAMMFLVGYLIAGIAAARCLCKQVGASDGPFAILRISIADTHNQEEAELWVKEKIGKIFLSEQQLASGMAEHVLHRMGKLHTEPHSHSH